jgi:uncharacterized protein
MTIERRNLTQEFRVSNDGEPSKISGYAALFDVASSNMGGWTETIDPHAFDGVLSQSPDIRALWNHNPDHVLGRTTADTLVLTLDARGLSYIINPPDTTLANDLMVSMRRKDVTQSSFSFVCKRDQWTDNADGTVTRRILEFGEVLDISPVTYPAYDATTAQARSLPESMPVEMRSRLEKRALDTDDDDDGDCPCGCPQCAVGACGICSSDPQCVGADRSAFNAERERMKMRLALLNT